MWWRLALVLLISLMLSLLELARADHGPRVSQLGGSVLCLDAASVRSVVERAEGRDEALEGRLERQLLAEMQEVFGRLDVAFEAQPGCHSALAYTHFQVLARYLDPETYLNFPDATYSYTMILQVGPFEEIALLELEEAAPGARHILFGNALHSEAETGVSIGDHLATTGDEQVWALARAWWDDNAEGYARARSRPLAPLVGSGLALALVLLGWRVLLRRR